MIAASNSEAAVDTRYQHPGLRKGCLLCGFWGLCISEFARALGRIGSTYRRESGSNGSVGGYDPDISQRHREAEWMIRISETSFRIE